MYVLNPALAPVHCMGACTLVPRKAGVNSEFTANAHAKYPSKYLYAACTSGILDEVAERRMCDATNSRHASLRWAQQPLTKRHSSKASLPDQHQRWITSGNESEGSTDMRPSLFVGAYTAVTKALWHKRLNWRGTTPVGAALPPIYEKHPELTSVEYPFTTDREFLEMVWFPVTLLPFNPSVSYIYRRTRLIVCMIIFTYSRHL